MGNNLELIRQNIDKIDHSCKLFNLSLTKLREYHGTFKSVCENFSIDFQEFQEIFQSLNTKDSEDFNKIFSLWDNNKNGLIDALELFSGLILFADAKFQEKIRFLFDIFDLNELNTLSLVDIEYMFNCCIASSLRICKCQLELNQQVIDDFVSNNFPKDSRINVSKLIYQSCQSTEIRKYLEIINRELPEKEELELNEFILRLEDPEFMIPKHLKKNTVEFIEGEKQALLFQNTGKVLNNTPHKKKVEYLKNFIKNNTLVEAKQSLTTKLELSWVYGFRCDDLLTNFVFHEDVETQGNRKLVYFVANLVVVYYYKENKQRHFFEHKSKVSSIALAKYDNQVATGDCGKQPFIHVWNVNTRKVLHTIKAKHSFDIYSLRFVN